MGFLITAGACISLYAVLLLEGVRNNPNPIFSLMVNIAALFIGIELAFPKWRAWRKSHLAGWPVGSLLIILSIIFGLIIYGVSSGLDIGLTLFFAVLFFAADRHDSLRAK